MRKAGTAIVMQSDGWMRLFSRGTSMRFRLMARVCLTVLATFTWLGATTAGARAVDVPASAFYFSSELSSQTSLPECLPEDLVGTVTGTEVTEGHATDTGFTFHANGTTTLTYQVGFPDGRYVLGVAVEHFGFRNNGWPTQSNHVSVVRETRTVYSADGDPVGTGTIRALFELNFRDLNGNGQLDEGEVRSTVDHFSFTCN